MSEVRLPGKPVSLFPLSLEADPGESVALHLPVAHDETPRHIVICNDNYKFTAFSHNILQEIAVVNEVTGMFHNEIVMKRTGSYKIL